MSHKSGGESLRLTENFIHGCVLRYVLIFVLHNLFVFKVKVTFSSYCVSIQYTMYNMRYDLSMPPRGSSTIVCNAATIEVG